MIHLDTNLLIDLVTIGSPHIAVIRQWLENGEELAVSAIAWSEFLNGPHTKQQKDAVTGDAVGVLLIGVPVSSATGGDRETAIAVEKGRLAAIEGAIGGRC